MSKDIKANWSKATKLSRVISVEIQRELLWFIFVLFIGGGRVTHNAANAAPQDRVAGSGYALFHDAHFELVHK